MSVQFRPLATIIINNNNIMKTIIELQGELTHRRNELNLINAERVIKEKEIKDIQDEVMFRLNEIITSERSIGNLRN